MNPPSQRNPYARQQAARRLEALSGTATPKTLMEAVGHAFRVKGDYLATFSQRPLVSRARFATWKLLREVWAYGDGEIAQASGGRHCSSVSHGIARANYLLVTDEDFRRRFNEVLENIGKPIKHITTIYT